MLMLLMCSENARLHEIVKTKMKEAEIWKVKADQSEKMYVSLESQLNVVYFFIITTLVFELAFHVTSLNIFLLILLHVSIPFWFFQLIF